MSFHPGQKVVFVGYPHPDFYGRDIKVKVGHVYTVTSTFMWFGEQGIYLQEFFLDTGWMAHGFRPVTDKKTDISIFTRLLKTKELETT